MESTVFCNVSQVLVSNMYVQIGTSIGTRHFTVSVPFTRHLSPTGSAHLYPYIRSAVVWNLLISVRVKLDFSRAPLQGLPRPYIDRMGHRYSKVFDCWVAYAQSRVKAPKVDMQDGPLSVSVGGQQWRAVAIGVQQAHAPLAFSPLAGESKNTSSRTAIAEDCMAMVLQRIDEDDDGQLTVALEALRASCSDQNEIEKMLNQSWFLAENNYHESKSRDSSDAETREARLSISSTRRSARAGQCSDACAVCRALGEG